MKLTIVIPALNEERGIGSIIERTLAARETIVRNSPVTAVEVIVVSDGSTDRTAEVAAAYDEVRLIVFEKNRGYGAAIKEGFRVGDGDLVGFLDADGTCDPVFFSELCRALISERAAVALGSRMGPNSHMPRIRRLGNRIYAVLLSALSNKPITDTASGMRVIRRDALAQLYPLPDGLHFTPAMSARVLMDDRMAIVERAMPYEERIGESKLHVLKDGVRFLQTIFEMTLMWQPAKLFVIGAASCFTLMALLAMHPIEMWLSRGVLREDMIYRLLFCSLLGSVGVTALSVGFICEHVRRLLDERPRPRRFGWCVLDRVYTFRGFATASTICVPLLGWLVGRSAWTWVTRGFVADHWSRSVLAGLIVFGLVQMLVTTMAANLLRFHAARRRMDESVGVSAATSTPTRVSGGPGRGVATVRPHVGAGQTRTAAPAL